MKMKKYINVQFYLKFLHLLHVFFNIVAKCMFLTQTAEKKIAFF